VLVQRLAAERCRNDGDLASVLRSVKCMIDLLTEVFSALGLAGQIKHPTARTYVCCFVVGAIAANLIVFFMIGSSIGSGKALAVMIGQFLSSMGIGVPLLGGLMATSILWFPKSGS